MQRIFGIVLIVAGVVLLYAGLARRDSMMGGAAEMGTKVANKVDGGTRVPEHTWYIAGGAVLLVAGAGLNLRRAA